MILMDEARGWLIGLAIAAALAVGTLLWVNTDSSSDVAEASTDETGFPTATISNSWQDATPNFAAGDVADEGHGNGGESPGWGKLTVQDLCLQEDIDLALAESRLETYGLPTDLTQRIRDLADSSGYKPSEVVDLLLGLEPGAECDDPDCDCDSESSSTGKGHEDNKCDDETSSDEPSSDRTDSE